MNSTYTFVWPNGFENNKVRIIGKIVQMPEYSFIPKARVFLMECSDSSISNSIIPVTISDSRYDLFFTNRKLKTGDTVAVYGSLSSFKSTETIRNGKPFSLFKQYVRLRHMQTHYSPIQYATMGVASGPLVNTQAWTSMDGKEHFHVFIKAFNLDHDSKLNFTCPANYRASIENLNQGTRITFKYKLKGHLKDGDPILYAYPFFVTSRFLPPDNVFDLGYFPPSKKEIEKPELILPPADDTPTL